MTKQDCPFCGKKKITDRHIRLCPKKPQDEAESPLVEEKVDLPIPAEISIPEAIPSKQDEVKTLNCPTCGEKSIWLNSLDYRCPKCGDREMKQSLPAGVK